MPKATRTSPPQLVLVGAGRRAREVYGPLLKGPLAGRFALLGLVSRSGDRARDLADALGLPWSLHLEEALARWRPDAAVVCVSSPANAEIGCRVLAAGVPALLETPLGLSVDEARSVVAAADRAGVPVEVAEQNPRAPWAALSTRLAADGFLGQVRLVAADLANYRYHAAAVARALLGRGHRGIDAVAHRVAPRPDRVLVAGTVSVDGGRAFQYRDAEVAFDPSGPWPRGRFVVYGDRGSVTEGGEVRLHSPATGVREARVERVAVLRGGREVTEALKVHGPVRLEWTPALPGAALDDDHQAVARCLLDLRERLDGRDPATGWSVRDGFQDLAWVDALEASAASGGRPVPIAAPD